MDVLLAALFVSLSLSEILTNESVTSPVLHAAVTVPLMGALAWRRQFPVVVTLAVLGANFAVNPDSEYTLILSLVLCCFTIGHECETPRSYVGLAMVLLPFLVGIVVQSSELVPSDIAAAAMFLAGPWTVGLLLRRHTERAADEVSRAHALALQREQQARAAAADERARIARELHDIVSHSISVVTIQTQAVRRRLGPEHAAEAQDLAMVEATAREALAEMRRLFGVLRADGETASLAPQPGLGELGRLVQSVGEDGPRITLDTEGTPYPLPPGLDLAAYRIAQEGLTNALRHAQAGSIEVLVRYARSAVEVEVSDDGHGLRPHGDAGHGLVGIRERVGLYGGSVELQPRPTGGARLTARLPVTEAP